MSCIIPSTLASAGDLQQIGVKAGATARVTGKDGVARVVALSPEQQQQAFARSLVAQNKRSVNKYVTALITASGEGTAIFGDAFAATTYADSNVSYTFQNGAQATSSAAAKAAFLNMIKSQPFKYVGIQIDVSAASLFTGLSWTEVIPDYDSTNTYDWKPKVNAALNTYAQIATTRFLRVGGEFNGNWGLYITGLANGNTVNFTFNVVDIQRNW